MPDLETLLERAAEAYEPYPDAYERTVERARRLDRRRRIGIAALAVAVACGGLTAAVLAFARAPKATPVQSGPPVRILTGEMAIRCGSNVCLMRPDGSAYRPLLPNGRNVPFPQWDPAFSPDGSRVAFRGYYGTGDGQYALYVVGVGGCHLARLTDMAPSNPAWSPDGRTLVFDTSGVGSIYRIGADGHGLTRLTPGESSGFADGDPAWSSTGTITFVRYPDQHAFGDRFGRLYTMSSAGGAPRGLTGRPATIAGETTGFGEPAWSPDGQFLAAVVYTAADTRVVVLGKDGRVVRSVSPAGWTAFSPAWSPDGRSIAFLVLRRGATSLYVADADGSHLRRLPRGGAADQVAWGQRSASACTG